MSSPVKLYAETVLPTDFGSFRCLVFRETGPGRWRSEPVREHVALVRGDLGDGQAVLARMHSECLTGESLHSLKCDCRAQLDAALGQIASAGRGVLVYLRQEGRGIGLGDKIRAYALQAAGRDTVDANLDLGLPADARRYDVAAAIFEALGVRSLNLMTNNPAKIAALEALGLAVVEQRALWVDEQDENREYLAVKRARMGHLGTVGSTKRHG
jgi:GTP cyclohydrolase II